MLKSKPFKLLLLSLVLIAAGFIFLRDISGPSRKTKAVITRIETVYRPGTDPSDTEADHNVYVDYVADGTRYRDVLLGSYDFTMKEGKEISIRYNIHEPAKIHSGHATIAVWVLFLSGGACLIFSAGGLIVMRREMERA